MVTQVQGLPPGERDFEIYRMTAVEGVSSRNAAALFQISQTRVLQVRNRVFEWIATHVPPLDHLFPTQRLAAAEQLAVERLEFLYSEALDSWNRSQGDYSVSRLKGNQASEKVTTYCVSQGQVSYLTLAMRIAKELAKFGVVRAPVPMLEEEVEGTACPPAGFDSGGTPPEEDCSAVPLVEREPLGSGVLPDDASTAAASSSAAASASRGAGKRTPARRAGPVQVETDMARQGGPPRSLNRFERRRLKRRRKSNRGFRQ